MENVLIISSSKSACETLSDFMREAFRCNIRNAETIQQAKNIFDANAPCDLAIIYSPLSDGNGTSLAEYIIEIAMNRSFKLYEETVKLERKIDEIRTIDKAKFLLMQYKNMTEDEAHNYLEKCAMEKRKKKVIVATEIIDKINEQYL